MKYFLIVLSCAGCAQECVEYVDVTVPASTGIELDVIMFTATAVPMMKSVGYPAYVDRQCVKWRNYP